MARTSLLTSLLLVVACGSTTSDTDAGPTHDGGAIDAALHDSGSDAALDLATAPDLSSHPDSSVEVDSGAEMDAATGTDAGPATDAGTGTDAGGGTDAGVAISCLPHGGGTFPTFDRSCTSAADCASVLHTTDCCGNSISTGINSSEVAAFDAAEATCDAMYPGCGCPATPPRTDSGEVLLGSAPNIACATSADGRGMCFTYVVAAPPP